MLQDRVPREKLATRVIPYLAVKRSENKDSRLRISVYVQYCRGQGMESVIIIY